MSRSHHTEDKEDPNHSQNMFLGPLNTKIPLTGQPDTIPLSQLRTITSYDSCSLKK